MTDRGNERKKKVERNRRKGKERDKARNKQNFRAEVADNTLSNKAFGRE